MKQIYVRKDEIGIIGKFFKNDLISIDELISLIEDLDAEVDVLREKIEDMEEDIEENYKRISISEQVGINDKDFI